MSANQSASTWKVYTDGAIRPERLPGTPAISGLAAIVRDAQGRICYWWQRRAGALTCNEAEYAAAIFALEQLLRLPPGKRPHTVTVCSDSRVVVDQMTGRAEARAPALQKARERLRSLVKGFRGVSFQHIPREQNRLADALAFEALGESRAAQPSENPPGLHPEAIDEFLHTWRLP